MEMRPQTDSREQGLFPALAADGRPLLMLVALGLIASGMFALFLAATNAFLPQDIAFLGMDSQALCQLHGCRIVHFMFHDRVSYGGTLLAIGTLYLWLIAFPLKLGEEWAWWVLLLSGTAGFASFLTCLLYGYVDTWHLAATVGMLPLYVAGMSLTRRLLSGTRAGIGSLWRPSGSFTLRTRAGFGRASMLFVGFGMTLAGTIIAVLGATVIFVPQDVVYLGFTAAELDRISPHLLPLIAHDRSGFGGGLLSCGIAVFLLVWKAEMGRALWQALLLGGLTGFGCAIGVHYPMGYLSASHLAPAWLGGLAYLLGMGCLWPGPAVRLETGSTTAEVVR